MALVRAVAPAVPAVSLETARAHLNLTPCGSPAVHPDDSLVARLVSIATSELDGRDGWLGRALINQTWIKTLDQFPGCSGRIFLPLTSAKYLGLSPVPAPVQAVSYVDPDGVTVVLTEGVDFEVVVEHDPIYIRPVYGTTWPSTRCAWGTVRITYDAGYGAADTDIPPEIASYILIRVGQLYEFRELVLAGTIIAAVPYYRDSLENVRLRGYE